MKNFFALICLSLTLTAWSQDLCLRQRSDYAALLEFPENRMAFKNDGGLFNGGVCWWHSRLQRASLYLVSFRPEAPRPGALEVRHLLATLKRMNGTVVIPGFSDFKSFTEVHQKEIQKMLNAWQREDGFLNFEWRRGISGRSSLPAKKLLEKMHELFDFHNRSPIPVWIMAQVKGVVSHSFLIKEMMPVNGGYDLHVVDSNAPLRTREIMYREGDTSLRLVDDNYSFVPYVGFQEDFKKIGRALRAYCQNKNVEITSTLMSAPRGIIESEGP